MTGDRERVLMALQDAGAPGLTTDQMIEVGGERFNVCVNDLRAAGHDVQALKIREGSWRYWMDPPADDEPWSVGPFCAYCITGVSHIDHVESYLHLMPA
jgi:hypothetical protein